MGNEVLVGAEFWDFLGGEGTLEGLLLLFNSVGKKFKIKIHQRIKEVAKEKMGT